MSGSRGRRTGVCLYKPVVRLLFWSQTVYGDVRRSLLAEGAEETGACALAFQGTDELSFMGITFCRNCLVGVCRVCLFLLNWNWHFPG